MSTRFKLFLTAMMFAPAALLAQSGRIVGTITDAESRQGLPSASVTLVGTGRGANTDADGRFTVYNVPAGIYEVRVQRIGMAMKSVSGVTVSAGSDSRVDISLDRAPLELAGVVVSASR